ncbi:glycoside hydrolase family 2 TIM barrel-domain containing protein [Mucilaginibacter lacusdianchii]|uniref:glycoside hydrolase family 2 TIM barrel-domain containing protein n=1 Tax=Mucilaginibacter lacusdianchii TaxID=2684211 RepID=UPI00131DCA97|nr:glycoside hydrolase family 2 TIM barrel-domain containing protein [Mucilaginibacter sp. JXJ CY 39]
MRINIHLKYYVLIACLLGLTSVQAQRKTENFNNGWRFNLGDDSLARNINYNDSKWRLLNLPQDWSIEGAFNEKNTTTQAEGGLPAGIGWYRKSFTMPVSAKDKKVFIDFDGVYRNSEVWINGHLLGKRPNGYISFRYDLTPYLRFGTTKNVVAVKADNSAQPNSRWYTGSGIYRNVWLVTTNKSYFTNGGTFIYTPHVSAATATVRVQTGIMPSGKALKLKTLIYNHQNKLVASQLSAIKAADDTVVSFTEQTLQINHPQLWSVNRPNLYKAQLQLVSDNNTILDSYSVNIGLRFFDFDVDKGFSLNGERMKIKGVCMHHDLGALGAVVNLRAMERQLEILKNMGCNAIRTSHNPPAPEFLDLCDRMGFIVMDEAFDMWRKKKSKQDYYQYFDAWHRVDLEDQVKRDRNHPSVMMWSIGNEIREQFDSTGISIGRELVKIVKNLDPTRPVTSALSESDPKKNFIYQSGALDLVGLNYHQEVYADFPKNYPGQKFIATETMSALETRGFYDKPTDTTRLWPHSSKEKYTKGNPEMAVTAYDNVAAYWGSTHEETWRIIKKHDYLSGLFVWTGFDYIGEPTPYPWPARSSYFGIIDLAGFPKDVYYMYQSEWTNKPVLHLLPHWNWNAGDTVDVWAYYNNADEVELFLNGKSLGIRKKQADDLHVSWKVKYESGTLKAISRKNGKEVLVRNLHTAGKPARILLTADRKAIRADNEDLSFVNVSIVDKDGNVVPDADNLVNFIVKGGKLAGVDNGSPVSMESFRASNRKAFHGLCLAILQASAKASTIELTATAAGLPASKITIKAR